MVGSAVIQEVVSRVSSFLLGKCEDMESKGHIIERLEMALAEMEFALERSVKLPITDVSLLHRRKVIKHAYLEATNLLEKHKRRQPQQENKEIERIPNGRSLSSLSLISLNKDESLCLSCSDVQRFEWFADCASKFVRDVESGCSLRHYTFCNPLVRRLLEGKILGYERMQGTQVRHCYIWPMCFEGRGVEAELQYRYEDRKMPEKDFRLTLMLRLSESTDIVAIAIKCLLSLASQFKLVTESAEGELSLVPNLLLDTCNSGALSLVGIQPQYIRYSDIFRPDPICCKSKGEGFSPENIISAELSRILPEPVMFADFRCYISAQEECGGLIRSMDDAHRPPPELAALVTPHLVQEGLKESYAYEVVGFKEQRRDGSMQEMSEMVRSQAISRFIRQPQLTDYGMLWISPHGCAYYGVQKINSVMASVPGADDSSKTKRAAKRRRRNCG
ncbi:hypothetical protein HU200_027966 [Digitaria exilis]|uniref:Uncharacterized protein n=1 Tax=Digitaria exilis TaxID=1010633 RepID=A0A835C0R4_9POAL|nr:hypothetical protein HU200_027966 [Digitaria exilis]